ncbi:hypothetical protein F2278_09555 [Salmonella enterica]|nr:hypothetical protein [Salmonella enterica]
MITVINLQYVKEKLVSIYRADGPHLSRGASGWRSAKVSTIREEFDEINDSMKVSSSRMKNKVGAQKGAFIKMKQENIYIYQRECAECYVPIISIK